MVPRHATAILSLFALSACATPAPKITHVSPIPVTDTSQALLDLRGLQNIQAYKDGALLDHKSVLPPGKQTLHFKFDAVISQAHRCDTGNWGPIHGGPEMLVILPVAIAIVGGSILACRAISSGMAKPRACYALTLDAKPGHRYVPKADKNTPVLIASRTGERASSAEAVPCSVVDDLSAEAEKRRRKAEAARMQVKAFQRRQRALGGDPAAMYRMYLEAGSRDEKLRWLCLAAHAGHKDARFAFAAFYHHDGSEFRGAQKTIRNDPLEAWAWYRRAADAAAGSPHRSTTKNGSPAATMAGAMARRLTEEQLTRAERQFARFQPNPAACRRRAWPSVATPPGWKPFEAPRYRPKPPPTPTASARRPAGLQETFTGKAWIMSRENGMYGWTETRIEFGQEGRVSGLRKRWLSSMDAGSSRDAGIWSATGEKLCMRWVKWAQGRELCYQIACSREGNCTANGPAPFAGRFQLK